MGFLELETIDVRCDLKLQQMLEAGAVASFVRRRLGVSQNSTAHVTVV